MGKMLTGGGVCNYGSGRGKLARTATDLMREGENRMKIDARVFDALMTVSNSSTLQ